MRIRELRLARGWRQATLAARAGVGLSTIQRCEASGRITLENLLRVADAVGRLDELAALFPPAAARSLDELAERAKAPTRKRGRT